VFYLLGSILASSWLTLSFKYLDRWRIATFPAIVLNYFICVLTGWAVSGNPPISADTWQQSWWPWAMLMGFLFISLFNVIAITAQRLGVTVASVANKLSLVIPFIFSLALYAEKASAAKWLGVILALLGVILVSRKSKQGLSGERLAGSAMMIWLPFLLFLGSGLLDTLVKYVEQTQLGNDRPDQFLMTAFGFAGIFGLLLLLLKSLRGQFPRDWRILPAGLLIGIPNYFSIWLLIMVLKAYPGNSSAILPINNMGVVLLSTLAALALLRERITKLNWIGIFLSLAAIALIAYG